MASILHLKRRIHAAQNVSKTTKAMQMIAASKLKKAQNAALAGRPYVEKLGMLTKNVVSKIGGDAVHPYMKERVSKDGKTLLIVLSPDKGLCGGLITNLLREFVRYSDQTPSNYVVIGKKMQRSVAAIGKEVIATFAFGTTTPTFEMVFPIIRIIDEYFLSEKVDNVKILSTHFTSIFTQKPAITTLLPITKDLGTAEEKVDEQKKPESFYLFEPSPTELLPSLLKHYMEMTLYQHLLESFVSEQSSRMVAMQNATSNAKDIIEDLRLEYNKTRQAKITSEILDITGARHHA